MLNKWLCYIAEYPWSPNFEPENQIQNSKEILLWAGITATKEESLSRRKKRRQCYTSVNRGSVAKRLNKGISIEHSCESPYIQGWKLEMMAEQVFDRYIENADKVMDLSYAMLEKHIADQKELPDNTDVIQRKQGEIEKLMNKRTNLIEMRAEGDIDKEMFRSKKQEIEDRVAKLTE